MEWISVKDKMPNIYKEVLCINIHSEEMFVGYKSLNKGWYNGEYYGAEVTHWTPLPEFPKETKHD